MNIQQPLLHIKIFEGLVNNFAKRQLCSFNQAVNSQHRHKIECRANSKRTQTAIVGSLEWTVLIGNWTQLTSSTTTQQFDPDQPPLSTIRHDCWGLCFAVFVYLFSQVLKTEEIRRSVPSGVSNFDHGEELEETVREGQREAND